MGLTLQPYWSPGVRDPGPEAKGAIIGFGDVHTRAHLYRAILEGLVYGLRAGANRSRSAVGRPIRLLRVAGGGSQSDAAMQITADVFGLPAERPEVYETSALGAAMNCAVGLGLHADYAAAVRGDGADRDGASSRTRGAQRAPTTTCIARSTARCISAAAAAVPPHPRITGYPPDLSRLGAYRPARAAG